MLGVSLIFFLISIFIWAIQTQLSIYYIPKTINIFSKTPSYQFFIKFLSSVPLFMTMICFSLFTRISRPVKASRVYLYPRMKHKFVMDITTHHPPSKRPRPLITNQPDRQNQEDLSLYCLKIAQGLLS